MSALLSSLTNTQYSLLRFLTCMLLYVAYIVLTYSAIVSYFHPALRMMNLVAFLVLAAVTLLFHHHCPKR